MSINFTRNYGFPLLLSLFASSSLNAQNSSVTLNGTDQYIDGSTDAALNAANIRTLEGWVKFNNFTGTQEVFSRSTNASGIEVLVYNNELNFFCMESLSNYSFVHVPVSALSPNVWYHIAATWDGLTKESMQLYVNGQSVGTRTDGGNINVSGITEPTASFRIGSWSDGGQARFLGGTVDQVRVWSVVRSATEIKQGMYNGVPAAVSGLIAAYNLDEGTGATTDNATGNATLDGTLVNSPAWNPSPVQYDYNALNFDGVDDEVLVPANSLFDLNTGTIEAWVQPTAFSTRATILGNRGTGGTRYSFHIASNQLLFDNGTSTLILPFSFTAGQWYHLAFVANGTNVAAYVDGVSIGTFSQTFGSGTGQPLSLGITEAGATDVDPFTGNIDEVRFWSTQRTQTEIQNNKDVTLIGSETGLLAMYSMNQGIQGGNNTSLVLAIDKVTGSGNHGVLTNFAMTGATSNWVAHALAALPVNFSYFNANKDGDKVVLRWETAQEQNSRDFSIERSADGVNYTSIGAVPAAGNSQVSIAYSFTDYAPEAGDNYYRLKQTDINSKFLYSKVVRVQIPAISAMKIAPNPARGTLNYTINGLRASQASVSIVDMLGKKMLVRSVTIQKGMNRLNIDVSSLPAGNYTLQVTNIATGQQTSERLMIAR